MSDAMEKLDMLLSSGDWKKATAVQEAIRALEAELAEWREAKKFLGPKALGEWQRAAKRVKESEIRAEAAEKKLAEAEELIKEHADPEDDAEGACPRCYDYIAEKLKAGGSESNCPCHCISCVHGHCDECFAVPPCRKPASPKEG